MTRSRVVTAPDLFVDNEVFLFARGPQPLAGVAWLRHEPPRHAHVMAMTTATAAVRRALPAHRLVLLCAHTATQADSAVTRARRLWKSLEARGVRIPRGARREERFTAVDGGLRWRGAILLDVDDVAQAMAVVHVEPASLVLAAPVSVTDRIDDLVGGGWTASERGPPREVVDWLCADDGIAMFPVGAFDDPESGIVAVASPGVVMRLVGPD